MNLTYILIILLVFLITAFFTLRFFLKRKATKTEKAESDESMKNLNTNKLKISIFKPISKDSVAQVGKSFIAEEVMDKNGNTIVINEEKYFKEDFNFSIDRVYEIMDFSLQLRNKSLGEKIKILDEQIKIQEDLLIEIDKDIELNKKYNYNDEELKLRQLKVYKDAHRKEKRGNYMRFGPGGVRMYEFVSIDGILYPYFFGADFFRVYPELLGKKKIFNSENTIFNIDNAKMLQSSLSWIPVILLLFGMLLTGGGAYWNYKNYQASNEMNLQINQGALICQNTQSSIVKNYGEMLDNYMKLKQEEIETLKKNQATNIDNTKGNIIINPGNILPTIK